MAVDLSCSNEASLRVKKCVVGFMAQSFRVEGWEFCGVRAFKAFGVWLQGPYIGALIIRIGFWGPLKYIYKEPPNSYRHLFRPLYYSTLKDPL